MSKKADKIIFSATIPVQQYGNVQPTIELSDVTIEEAEQLGLDYIKQLFSRLSTSGPLTDKNISNIHTSVIEKKNPLTKE